MYFGIIIREIWRFEHTFCTLRSEKQNKEATLRYFLSFQKAKMSLLINRPLALRGHVTNASFKQRVGILLMPKIDRAIKIILHPKFEGKRI